MEGVDFPLHDDPQDYRRAVAQIKHDPLSLGALVTTHKVNLLEAARDMFNYLDPYAVTCAEVSSISKNGALRASHGIWRDGLEPEIGWWLARRCWGRGLATEAATAALRDAFERVRLERVVSIARPANAASRRIMEKLGLEFECEFESEGVRLVRYAIDRARCVARWSAARGIR